MKKNDIIEFMKLKIANTFLIIVSIYVTLVICDWISKKSSK